MELETGGHSRPRNVDWKRAAALLYGDWGTSKTYVTGIAFALATFSSFWLVLAVGVLTALVGVNYIWVCKYFPEGGGVYSAARQHSKNLALIGAFLLVANYLVTAALSCFEAFVYFGFHFADAKRYAILMIFFIGAVNFFGPRHSGSLAVVLAVSTVAVVFVLALAALPHLPVAVSKLEAPKRTPTEWWVAFTGVILALSGVEAIANMTGVMPLDEGSTASKPRVTRTATKAIVPVLIEVVLLTTLFGLAMKALPDLIQLDEFGQAVLHPETGRPVTLHDGDMLHHMGQHFVDKPLSSVPFLGWLGEANVFSWIVRLVIGGLLLSATNTAIIALVSVLFLVCKDGDLPKPFAVLNRFGVPWIIMLITIIACILLLDIPGGEDALHTLAGLYAIGVVGAIAVNLGSCVTNFKLPMIWHERTVMTITFIVVAAIEITIAITNPGALLFVLGVVASGFIARGMTKGFRIPIPESAGRLARILTPGLMAKKEAAKVSAQAGPQKQLGPARAPAAIMVAARGVTPTLRYAVEQARLYNAQLFVLFAREQYTTIPVEMNENDDPEAKAVFDAVRSIGEGLEITTVYAVSDDAAWTIADNAAIAGVDLLILGHSRRMALTKVLRGDLLQKLGSILPEEIQLVIVG